jgi:hypothetical protein
VSRVPSDQYLAVRVRPSRTELWLSSLAPQQTNEFLF